MRILEKGQITCRKNATESEDHFHRNAFCRSAIPPANRFPGYRNVPLGSSANPGAILFENQRMKILITADLHYREQWFRLLSRAPEWDLICIAGDLLDMFNAEPRIVQARTVSRWVRELAKVTRVAICSGNHDNAGRQISAEALARLKQVNHLG
jgi:hypothetical protein